MKNITIKLYGKMSLIILFVILYSPIINEELHGSEETFAYKAFTVNHNQL